jgi:Terpene synthase family 2, C-terminal metal binding
MCQWCFAVDWRIDYLAESRTEVQDAVRRYGVVVEGDSTAGRDPLERFLANIRDDLASMPAFDALRRMWGDEVQRMLGAMAREWDWKSAYSGEDRAALPSFEEYLGNADSAGFCLVLSTHWVISGERYVPGHDEPISAGRYVQRVLRLMNDLATYDKDVRWGDLNSLMLGVTRADLTKHIDTLIGRCLGLLSPLRNSYPQLATYVGR